MTMKVTEGDSLPIALRLLMAIRNGTARVQTINPWPAPTRMTEEYVYDLCVMCEEPSFKDKQQSYDEEEQLLDLLLVEIGDRIQELRRLRG